MYKAKYSKLKYILATGNHIVYRGNNRNSDEIIMGNYTMVKMLGMELPCSQSKNIY